MEAGYEYDPDWEEIRQLHQQLFSLETRKANVAEHSIDRFLHALEAVGLRQDVINQPYFLWLLEHVANRNLGKVPIYQPFEIKDGVMTGRVTDDQIMGYLIWMNLLETGLPSRPVPIRHMLDVI